ncbi:hypothetical protein Leryth_011165 [Lithospermum erythrorhizon]|nr:hypothetical protein Leryth_011165 [Lithospermum erythrorhizon]
MKLKKFLSKMDDKNRVDMSSFLLFEATATTNMRLFIILMMKFVLREHEDEDEDEDEEEGVVDQDLKKGGDHKMWKPNKVDETPSITNVVCVESCVELMRQREQDKLFWKSCLES